MEMEMKMKSGVDPTKEKERIEIHIQQSVMKFARTIDGATWMYKL